MATRWILGLLTALLAIGGQTAEAQAPVTVGIVPFDGRAATVAEQLLGRGGFLFRGRGLFRSGILGGGHDAVRVCVSVWRDRRCRRGSLPKRQPRRGEARRG